VNDATAPTVRLVAPHESAALVEPLAELLIDCVEGGASVGFMLPLPHARAVAFWSGVAGGVERGERLLLVAEDDAGRVVGTVQLVVAQPDNQPHRADVSKMLVRRDSRRRGIAQRLLAALTDVARSAGKSVLVLDTVTGGDAERLYARDGWQRVGVVPDFCRTADGRLASTTYYTKGLAPG